MADRKQPHQKGPELEKHRHNARQVEGRLGKLGRVLNPAAAKLVCLSAFVQNSVKAAVESRFTLVSRLAATLQPQLIWEVVPVCRMIAAIGQFSTTEVLKAAKSMSLGRIADHEHPVRKHDDGWGALWLEQNSHDRIGAYRSLTAIGDELEEFAKRVPRTEFLAIHVRKATIPEQQGLQYTHPISRGGRSVPWYIMHNGCVPTVYRELGLSCSSFDTAEYFEYICPRMGDRVDADDVLRKLDHLSSKNTSANAFLVNQSHFYVVHWYPENSPYPRFYTVFVARTGRATFISSEVIRELAPANVWQPLPRVGLLEFPLPIFQPIT